MSNTRKYIKLFENFIEASDKYAQLIQDIARIFIELDDERFKEIIVSKSQDDLNYDESTASVDGQFQCSFDIKTEDGIDRDCLIGGNFSLEWYRTRRADPGNYYNEPTGPDGDVKINFYDIDAFFAYTVDTDELDIEEADAAKIHRILQDGELLDPVIDKIKELIDIKIR